jgi:hypothetical protein
MTTSFYLAIGALVVSVILAFMTVIAYFVYGASSTIFITLAMALALMHVIFIISGAVTFIVVLFKDSWK